MVVSPDEARSFEGTLGAAHAPSPDVWPHVLYSARLLESWRGRWPGSAPDSAVAEVARLRESVAVDGAELGAVLFSRPPDRERERWVQRAEAAAARLDLPLLDLTHVLAQHDWSTELSVHPLDDHPNQTAHALAAEATLDWLAGGGVPGTWPLSGS